MRLDWRGAAGIITLVGGLYLARDWVILMDEDSAFDMPTHDFYSWLSPERCQIEWRMDEGLANLCHGYAHNIAYAAIGLLFVTIVLLAWIWLRPFRK